MVIQVFISILIIIFICSCSEEENILNHSGFGPTYHSYPSWFSVSEITFKNHGFIRVSPSGGGDVDPSKIGIYVYNLDNEDYSLLVPYGDQPNSSSGSGFLTCTLNNAIVILNNGNTSILNYSPSGDRRFPSVNMDGSQIAWSERFNPLGPEFDGVWIHHTDTDSTVCLGRGVITTWNRILSDRLALIIFNFENKRMLCEYDVSENAIIDTLYTSPSENYEIRYFSYSPDSRKIVMSIIDINIENSGIWILDIDTKSLEKISSHYKVRGISWGERGIIYCRDCDEINDYGCGVIWMIDPVTYNEIQLTDRFQFVNGDQ